MAYMSQDHKKELAPQIKKILKKYNLKGSLGVRNHSTLVLNIKSGPLDLCKRHDELAKADNEWRGFDFHPCDGNFRVNEYHVRSFWGEDTVEAKLFTELVDAMKGKDYFCEDDIMTDYFHRSHYIDINVGKWDKPYILTEAV